MKKIIVIICLLIYLGFINNVKSDVIIPKEAIRLRIIANSNSDYDQNIKLKLSVEINKEIQKLLSNTSNVYDARNIIKNNVDNLNNKIEKFLKKENYNMNYKIVYGNNYFPSKTYNGVIYKEGLYESLVITLGSGRGKNWWCVLFPPLCLVEKDNNYKLFVQELIDKYF